MPSLSDLAELYETKGYYIRERRPFRWRRVRRPNNRIVKKKRPATFTLRPLKAHQVYGGRTGALDRFQGICGYFFGGGWVFGFIENERFRATPEAFEAYTTDSDADLKFRAGNVASRAPAWGEMVWRPGDTIPDNIPADRYMNVLVRRADFESAGALPPRQTLRALDRLSFAHDRELRDRDFKSWNGEIEPGDDVYCALTNNAHLKLRKGLDDIVWNELIDEWEQAKADMSKDTWERMGSLIHYEKDLANFSSLVLSFAIYSDTPIDIDTPPVAPAHAMENLAVRLAPPVINSRQITLDDLRDEEPELAASKARKEIKHLMEEQKTYNDLREQDNR